MDTIKINKYKTEMIAHAGLAGLESSNTNAGFIAAGNRSYFGIETDLNVTKDGKIVAFHDLNTRHATGIDMELSQHTLEELQQLPLYDCPFFWDMEDYGYTKQEGQFRSDLRIPSLSEYIAICKKYGKVAVPELKSPMTPETIAAIIEEFRRQDYLEQTIFISFHRQNLVEVRKLVPQQTVQYLTDEKTVFTDAFLDQVAADGFDLDIHVFTTTKELIDRIHARGMKINCWTVDWPKRAEEIAQWGADYITSDILE